ncbi:MAG: hypothetical protein JF887_00575 [Candidatus Dormibacteraeota bacterium]|uniref:Uncharacterized protein n=1 Tax=Candidatus Amunia macphersoniae TaxID=3127014 RepID=A0A934NIE7_9BACT|nr:hypothetical protein [Candidatus Dormibacteraeota bacterium]
MRDADPVDGRSPELPGPEYGVTPSPVQGRENTLSSRGAGAELEPPAYLGREFGIAGRTRDHGRTNALGALLTLTLVLALPLISGAPLDVVVLCSVLLAGCVIGAALLIAAEIRAARW